MQDNFNNQNYLPEEDSLDIKKEAGYYLFFWPYFLATVDLRQRFGHCLTGPASKLNHYARRAALVCNHRLRGHHCAKFGLLYGCYPLAGGVFGGDYRHCTYVRLSYCRDDGQ